MDLTLPATVLSRPALAAVLEVLAGTTHPLAGREVARLARTGSVQAVFDALSHLVDHGLVVRQEVGRTHLYRLNHEHLAAEPTLALARLRASLLGGIREAIARWRIRPVHVSLFGSAARGDGSVTSDIDLLVVRSGRTRADNQEWLKQLDTLASQILRWSGNEARWLELAESELRRTVRNRNAIVDEWREDAIDLAGVPLRTMLRSVA